VHDYAVQLLLGLFVAVLISAVDVVFFFCRLVINDFQNNSNF